MSDFIVTLVKKMLIYHCKLRFFLTSKALNPNILDQTPTLKKTLNNRI
jgi:hypothetical protein